VLATFQSPVRISVAIARTGGLNAEAADVCTVTGHLCNLAATLCMLSGDLCIVSAGLCRLTAHL